MPYVHSKLVSILDHLSNEISDFRSTFDHLESRRTQLSFQTEDQDLMYLTVSNLQRYSIADLRKGIEKAYLESFELDKTLSKRIKRIPLNLPVEILLREQENVLKQKTSESGLN